MKISIVVPTYNEGENIMPLVERIDKALEGLLTLLGIAGYWFYCRRKRRTRITGSF